MSSTNRGAVRVPQDRYMTPAYTVDSLLNVLKHDVLDDLFFHEPCRGEGAIYDRMPSLIKSYCELSMGRDYLKTEIPATDFIVTNPPFSLALDFLSKSLSEALSVIYLLRLDFLGSKKRKEFWNANQPSHILVVSKRPCFVAMCKPCGVSTQPHVRECPVCGGRTRRTTDSPEYAWFCWDELGIVNLPKGVHVL